MGGARVLTSIVVPARNAEDTLASALASVLAQGVVPIEVMVVDGSSGDRTVAVAEGFPGVRVMQQPGRGLADARNAGLAAVSGELVGFLDADDEFTPGRLALMRDRLLADPACAAVLGHMVRTDVGGASAQYGEGWLDRPLPALTPGGMLARRAMFARVGPFDTSLTIACDSDWLARLEDLRLPVALLPEVVLVKRVHAGNLSADTATLRREMLVVARRRLARRRHSGGGCEP